MKIAEEIFEKATIRGFADYLLFGLAPDPDGRDYKARLDETYKEFENIALKYNPNGASDLLASANAMTCENACVYLEIGIQVGVLLIADILKNVQGEQTGDHPIDYRAINPSMQSDMKKALNVIMSESAGNEKIKNACDILEHWGNPRTEIQEG